MSLPTEIKQWISHQDGLENLSQTTSPMPTPGPSEVLVKISAVTNAEGRDAAPLLLRGHAVGGARDGALWEDCASFQVALRGCALAERAQSPKKL